MATLQQSKKTPAEFIAAAIFFLFIVVMLPGTAGYDIDDKFWLAWLNFIHEHGLRNTYSSGTDYMPVYQYVLWAYSKFAGSPEIIAERIYYLKVVTLAFDFFSLYLLYKWIDRRYSYLLILIIALGNVGYSYNTIIWGQIDTIWTAFVFAALYFAWIEKLTASAVCFVLALCTKLQAIIFLPHWLILFSCAVIATESVRRLQQILVAVASASIIGAILFVPFAFGEGGLGAIWKVILLAADRFPRLSLSADNMWCWLIRRAGEISDREEAIAGVSYKAIGIVVFFVTSAAALWPLVANAIRAVYRRDSNVAQRLDRELIWLSAGIVGVLFFYCNTQMHERYAYPAGIFFTAVGFYANRWAPLILFSIAQFLNLEVITRWLRLKNYHTLIFHPRFVSAIFLASIVWAFVLLYKRYFRLRAEALRLR